VALESRDMDSQLVEEDRWLDGNGHSCSMLDIYRWCAYREGDHGDYAGAARVRADVQRQLDAGAAAQLAPAFIDQQCQRCELWFLASLATAWQCQRPSSLVRIE
jgi:hypothetical protein